MRTGIITLFISILLFVGGHPRSIALACTREKIGVEKGEIITVFIGYLVGLYFGVVFFYLLGRGEVQAVELVGNGKHTFYCLV